MKRYKLHNFLLAFLCVISGLFVTAGTTVIPSTVLINLLINTLRVLFIAYLVYGIVQIFKASNKGKDGNV
jgi:ABC-type bacteriocin/lantibiotic exporter with double-glycine peptidase domain